MNGLLTVREGARVADRTVALPADPDVAFDAYVAAHQQALVRFATLLSGSVVQAEDIVQDVLVRLYPRWSTLADPHPYVRRSIANEFLSWRRRWHTRHVHVAPDALLDRPVPDSFADAPDPRLWALVQTLPRQQRAAVVLRYWEGLDDAEIAEVLQCKAVTVRAHVSRGLAFLRAGLGQAGESDA